MNIPISGIGAFIDFAVLFYFYYRIKKNSQEGNTFFEYFSKFSLFFGLFYLFFAAPILLTPQISFLIGLGYLVGHVFAYVAFGYLARIVLLINKPAYDSGKVFKAYLLIGALLTLANIYFFNYPRVLESGITEWNQNNLIGVSIILFGLTAFLPAAISFIRQGILKPEQRKRYLFIGTAFLMIIVGGPMHDVAKTAGMNLLADLVTTLGFISMFLGIMMDSKKTNKKGE